MVKTKTKYTKEFKEGAIKLVIKEGYTRAEAAKNLGIDAKNLSRWIQKSRQGNQSAKLISSSLAVTEQAELQQLRKEVRRLRMERDILKKATIFFANAKA